MRELIDGLQVYRVPVQLTVTADAFVLATNAGDARVQAVKIKDLKGLFDFDTETLFVNDEQDAELKNLVEVKMLDDEPKPVDTHDYSPEHHNAFDEDIHCVEGDNELPLKS